MVSDVELTAGCARGRGLASARQKSQARRLVGPALDSAQLVNSVAAAAGRGLLQQVTPAARDSQPTGGPGPAAQSASQRPYGTPILPSARVVAHTTRPNAESRRAEQRRRGGGAQGIPPPSLPRAEEELAAAP